MGISKVSRCLSGVVPISGPQTFGIRPGVRVYYHSLHVDIARVLVEGQRTKSKHAVASYCLRSLMFLPLIETCTLKTVDELKRATDNTALPSTTIRNGSEDKT